MSNNQKSMCACHNNSNLQQFTQFDKNLQLCYPQLPELFSVDKFNTQSSKAWKEIIKGSEWRGSKTGSGIEMVKKVERLKKKN